MVPYPPEWVEWVAVIVVGLPILAGYAMIGWAVMTAIFEKFWENS